MDGMVYICRVDALWNINSETNASSTRIEKVFDNEDAASNWVNESRNKFPENYCCKRSSIKAENWRYGTFYDVEYIDDLGDLNSVSYHVESHMLKSS